MPIQTGRNSGCPDADTAPMIWVSLNHCHTYHQGEGGGEKTEKRELIYLILKCNSAL